MNLTVVALAKLGYQYLTLWPQRAELIQYFPEYRSVQTGRFVVRYFPALAIFTLVLAIGVGGSSYISTALFYGLFIASMPAQALVILGVKADKLLPPSLAAWYKEGVARYNEQGGDMKLSIHKPRYIDLARLLNMTFAQQTK